MRYRASEPDAHRRTARHGQHRHARHQPLEVEEGEEEAVDDLNGSEDDDEDEAEAEEETAVEGRFSMRSSASPTPALSPNIN
jgi:hypothetical protein